MIRDPGPLHSLGNGVTSRDVPINEGEQEGDAPNSGFVSRALNNHPIMRFVASTAATMAVAGILSKFTKKGGLKLIKFAEEKTGKNSAGLASRSIQSAKEIRKTLDELQGVNRFVQNEADPYSKLVFGSKDTGLTTGYDGISSERWGSGYLTKEDRALNKTGIFGESTANWAFRDELQQRLVRAGRRMPYELPAFYIGQKGLVDPLFGERKENDKKVKWYNPVDVVADFTTESVKSLATMIIPFEVAGAGVGQARSSLHTLRYAANDMRNLTPVKQAVHKNFVNVSELLSEVGHDFTSITNKVLKKGAQATGSFSAAAEEFRAQETGLLQTLHRLRHGSKALYENERNAGSSRAKIAKVQFSTLFKGFKEPDSTTTTSAFDIIPAFKGIRVAAKQSRIEYKKLGSAQEAMENAIAYNRVLSKTGSLFADKNDLDSAINRLQSQHSSKLARLAGGVRTVGGGGPGSDKFTSGEFYKGHQEGAYKDLLEEELIAKHIDPSDAQNFIRHLNVTIPKGMTHPSKVITIGKTKIHEVGDTAADSIDDFFGQIIKRYKRIEGSEGLVKSLQDSPNALKEAVENAQNAFTSKEFQKRLNNNIKSSWNKYYRDDLHNAASGVLKPKKALYQDFIGQPTNAKKEFLQRKTAQTLGIRLTETDGRIVSNDIVVDQLRRRGLDTDDFTSLRAFLIKNRQMTSGIFKGGQNLFGLQQLTIDEARDRGMFAHMRPEEQKIISDLAGKTAINDPVSKSIGLSRLDGAYKTKSGEILDFSSIKSTFGKAANFFASEFKIPLLNFNPTDLFGYNSFTEMSRKSPIQFISSRSVQPFLKDGAETRADFYMWHRTRGTKGKVTGFRTSRSGDILSEELKGSYRALPTNSADLLTRHTRYGAANEGKSPDEIRGVVPPKLLQKLGVTDDQYLRFKKKAAIDTEQPNSIFNLISRFRKRGYDLENESTMAKLIRGESVEQKVGGSTRSLKLAEENGTLRVVDHQGQIVDDFSEADVLRGMHGLSKETFQYGIPRLVMQQLEKINPGLFKFNGQSVSPLHSEKDLRSIAEGLKAAEPQLIRDLRAKGIQDPTEILASRSRIEGLTNLSNLNSTSLLSKKSPTISTRLDELKNEIFRYISQRNQLLNGSSNDDIFIHIQEAVDDLVKRRVISSSQRAEAQAAGLATMFNMSAFRTFRNNESNISSARKAALEMFNVLKNPKAAKLLDPFTEGQISQVSSNIKKKFSPLLAPMKKKLGTAGYKADELSIDTLGSGQAMTLVPTFGTAFSANPLATLKNAAGITTYSDPSGFSLGSVPMSQGVERLNRYFGTLGMQLDVSEFKGPLDLFARGMVGKRVLPMYAAGVTALTVDRTLGGMVNEKDSRGERVYSPLVLGSVAKVGVEAQAAMSGLVPGGASYGEKREQLVEGEVAIRQGRFWPLGNTPFKGGKINYYRPSWYRKLQGGAMFTSDTYDSPAEKFLFYNDISPLRPLDPYRFERKHYSDRPYPITGEYFSGPFGPLTPALNATLGKVLKPQKMMHEEELMAGLGSYAPAGESGAYDATAYSGGGQMGGDYGGFGGGGSGGSPGYGRGSGFGGGGTQSAANARYSSMSAPTYTAQGSTRQTLAAVNSEYADLSYGPPKVSKVMSPRIVAAGTPMSPAKLQFQGGELGYRSQEMLGIYGFALGHAREGLGFGQSDFEPQKSVLQSASKAYGTSRAFWDLNLGGLGDVPVGGAEGIGNIEFSEIVRRFIPKDRAGVDYINPIKNTMGKQHPFLPGAEYYINFQTGDPFTKVQEGEVRLPGVGYERFNRLHPDETGNYGLIDQLNILGDVAPYSQQYKQVSSQLDKMSLSAEDRIEVAETRQQVEDTTTKKEFSPYKYKGSSAEELAQHPYRFTAGRIGEYLAHSDNFVLNKTLGEKTAVEDWERSNVYGTTFPQWQNPIESYISPMINKATQRNPILASASLATAGALFGRTHRARLFGTAVGGIAGFAASAATDVRQFLTGERYIPKERKKELALEEYSDILTYTKNTRLAAMARQSGNNGEAAQYESAAGRTMYGADVHSPNIESLSLAVPKRKREHFKAMINAPQEERGRILSTAGRLERRLYEGAWGMDVEKRPDLEDFFTKHELPDQDWEGWHPNTNVDHVKIKAGQSMGLDMSQMGYYPQQIKEANLTNPSYPNFYGTNDRSDVSSRLKMLMSGFGVSGTVTPVVTPFGSQQINVNAGVS